MSDKHLTLGHYRWGLLVSRAARYSAPRGEGVVALLKALLDRLGEWKELNEFLAAVTFLHEGVHILQDASTGVGHWDFWQTANFLASNEFWRVRSPEERNGYYIGLAPRFVTFQQEHSLHSLRRLSNKRDLDYTGALVAEGANSRWTGYFPWADFRIEDLLEGDAALYTVLELRSLNSTAEARIIMQENRAFYDPVELPRVYQRARILVERALKHLASHPKFALAVDSMLDFVCDCAFAHPSPADLARSDLSLEDCYPTIKFFRLLDAFDKLSVEETGAFVNQLMIKLDSFAAEQILIADTPYHDMPRSKIYEGWRTCFQSSPVPQLQTIFDFRSEIARVRSQRRSPFDRQTSARDAYLVPFIQMTPMGMNWDIPYPAGESDKFPEKAHELFSSIMSFARDRMLLDAIADRQPYVCPIGEARILCRAMTPTCTAGLEPIEQAYPVPQDSRCSIWNGELQREWRTAFRIPNE